MKTGLLWFDNDKERPLPDKVAQAAAHYRAKFGQQPNRCYCHSADLNGEAGSVNCVTVAAASNVLKWHIWIGREDEKIIHRNRQN